ncbi:DcaP family trimeric outer membrane transporter [uncultured Marinobacter sp.]|uniref:DcaP family trimeric outer membrane transporter n=1 Tax=uncultured Marinobacter sp. TaxID=187379 RepID=UPI0025EE2E5A|nr:DcaP family trimeric outer membrane transporter [uncultured Marinobacter sp.]
MKIVQRKSLLSTISAGVLVSTFSSGAMGQSLRDYDLRIKDLENEIKEIKEYRGDLSRDQESEPKKYVRAGQSPRSFIVPGTETELAFHGLIQLNVAVGENGSGLPSQSLFAPTLANTPSGDVEGKDTATEFSVRRSRFWVTSSTPAGGADLKTHIEIDFAGGTGSESFTNNHDLRLRRAFADYKNWRVGQDYSTFLDFASLGELLNYGSHGNAIFIRQPQIRYTSPFDWGAVMLSAENSYENDVITVSGNVTDTDQDDQTVPDLVARLDYNVGKVHTSTKVMARQLKLDTVNQGDDSAWAGALSLTTRFPVFSDSVGLQYNYGALGRYMGLGVHPDAFVADGQIEGFDSWGASAVYTHRWGGKWKWRSTLAYAYTKADEDLDDFGPEIIDSSSSAHVNLVWSPMKNSSLGVELGRYSVKTRSGEEPNVFRINANAKYAF